MKLVLTTAKIAFLLSLLFLQAGTLLAQSSAPTKRVLVDISHGQRFYNDPATMSGKDSAFVERIRYMTGALAKNAASLNAGLSFLRTKVTQEALATCNLLFIHMPSSKYEPDEVQAIQQYLKNGGSLFIVMEVDYWSTLAQANVNDIVNPFGVVYKSDNPDTKSSGGYTDGGTVTGTRFRIPYHGARIVEGGTPFCFSNLTKDNPFGIYKEIKGGGKIIAMGDGMASLYMTSWEGVNDYQCSEFMHDALAWLLKK